LYRPRSIARLALIGIPIVLAPLIAAVVTAIVQVDRLAEESRSAVLEAELATRHSRALLQRLTDMHRPYLQYQVTGDSDYLAIYIERRGRFLEAVQELRETALTSAGAEHLQALIDQERALTDAISGDSTPGRRGLPVEEVDREWLRLVELARAILAESSRLIETQANRMTASAVELQRTLLMQATAVIPATLLLAAGLVILITRPMRALGQAIRHLGAGQFAETIHVRGSREIEELGRQLDWLRQRIVDLEKQKLTFLRHMSHELKTPLTTIREGSELLAEACADDSEEAEIAAIMCDSSLQLQKLIEDLLLFAKTQDVVTDFNLSEALRVDTLIRDVVAEHAVAIGSKDIDVACELSPITVRGDEKKLRLVVDNLLSNAIKYTPTGGRVTISLARRTDSVLLDVHDTGPGVDESETASIFEPFRLGSAQHHGSVKGTGLGLSIAKEYVEAHDGSIQVVDSTDGAHFRVTIPVDGPKLAAAH
jgi:two-component system, NtrC family, sensor histidine kinase GlrK